MFALRAAAAAAMAAPLHAVGSRAMSTAAHNSIGKTMRSSTNGLRCTIFGAYGFVGRYVTALLASSGTQCIIPFRGDDMEWRHLKVNGDLGVVAPVSYHPSDVDSVRRAVKGSDIVINLIGKDYETKHYVPWIVNSSFTNTHVTVAETIAKVAVEEGVTNLIHVSALAADSKSFSFFSRAKAAGESAVRAIAPGATIVRPADVYGPEDRFLNLFARLYGMLPRLPLVDGGSARVQPLYVQDLATAIYKIALSEDPEFMLAQTYEFAGPEEYTHREIVEFVFETIRATEPQVANVTPAIADALGKALSFLPNPILTADRILRMQADNVLSDAALAPAGAATKRLHDLGIEATSMESPGFTFLHRYRSGSHFLDIEGR